MPIPLEKFVQAHHFKANPFGTTNAEQERAHLSSFFVHVSWFDRLVGDTQSPESLLLFAPQGHGKTTHRIEVGRIAGDRRVNPALVVHFTDFDELFEAQQQSPQSNPYLRLLQKNTLIALDTLLHTAPERVDRLQRDQTMLNRFHALLTMFAPLRAYERGFTREHPDIADLVTAFEAMQMGIRPWLRELSSLTQAVGFSSVYVLIDGVDELAATRAVPETALNLLRPLLDAPGVLQESGFAFKFFLPESVEALMRQHDVGRLDRIPLYTLRWTDSELHTMLSRRLVSYSLLSETNQIVAVQALRDLCADDFDIDAAFVAAAQTSPRRLLDLGRRLIEQHCREVDDPDQLIAAETARRVLAEAEQAPAPAAAAPPAPTVPHAPPVVPSAPTVPLLFFDQRGDLWLGDKVCNSNPLPRQLRTCMQYLWDHRHETVRYDDLMYALYGDDLSVRSDPRNSIDKIVRRLRAVLEPEHPGSNTYIRVQPGTGYELRNFRDTF
jgi:hypothetical protein